ncbi:transcription antitermination factor NusB [bacterium]|nr:transcription antitermination factor NusB [bacterium]
MDIPGPKTRKDARMVALQVLYAVELTQQDPEDALRMMENGEERHRDFVRTLVHTTHRYRNRMDELIGSKSERWNIDRIALIDHIILRMALCELYHMPDIPPKVTINEAIELGKDFSTDQSGRFINGLLDAIYLEHEQEILGKKKDEAAKAGPHKPKHNSPHKKPNGPGPASKKQNGNNRGGGKR